MAIFTDEELLAAQSVIEAAIRENFPNISVRRGTVMKELVAKASAVGYAVINKMLEDFKATDTLSAIVENPLEVDDSVIDAILSNWFITRKQGSKSSGLIKITMATNRSLFLASGTVFTAANGLEFETTSTALVEETPTSSTSILLHEEESSGTYYFILPVTATDVGDAYSIPQDTQLDNDTIGADLVLVEAFTDFAGGVSTETSSELLERAKQAITVRDLVTTKAIKAVLKEEFTAMTDISVIGYGDGEMIRDHLGGMGFGCGGRVNIYVRNSLDPVILTLEKTLDEDSRFTLTEVGTEVPFYRIESIVPVSAPTTVLDDFDIEFSIADNPANDMQSEVYNSRFSIYERATVTVNNPGYEETEVYVRISVPTQVQDIQLFVLDEENHVPAADLLVLGIIPVFVTVDMQIVRSITGPSVDLDEIKQAVKTHINSIPAGSTLDVSKIVQLVQGFSISRLNLSNLVITGEQHMPDGSIVQLTAVDALSVLTDRYLGVSQKNSAYFITLDDITITEISL